MKGKPMFFSVMMAVFSGLFFAVSSLGYKMGERRQCRAQAFLFVFAATGGGVAGVKAIFETTQWGEPRLWLLGSAMGIFLNLAIFFVLQANRFGPAFMSWTVLNLSLLLPVILSPILFGDRFFWLDLMIMGFFILMLWSFAKGMPNGFAGKKEGGMVHILMLLAVFFANGVLQLGNKYKYILFGDLNTSGFLFILYLSGALLALLVIYTQGSRPFPSAAEFRVGMGTGFLNGTGAIFYVGAMNLPASVVFPVSAGIGLVGGVFLTIFIFAERMDRFKAMGVAFGFMALALAVMREPFAKYLNPF
jgi:multidrug transporter EmrE-like cation transporter